MGRHPKIGEPEVITQVTSYFGGTNGEEGTPSRKTPILRYMWSGMVEKIPGRWGCVIWRKTTWWFGIDPKYRRMLWVPVAYYNLNTHLIRTTIVFRFPSLSPAPSSVVTTKLLHRHLHPIEATTYQFSKAHDPMGVGMGLYWSMDLREMCANYQVISAKMPKDDFPKTNSSLF
jgi:hypothetical protein